MTIVALSEFLKYIIVNQPTIVNFGDHLRLCGYQITEQSSYDTDT